MVLIRRGRRRRRTIVIVSHVCPFPSTQGNRRRIRTLIEWLKEEGFHVVYVLQPLDVDSPEAIGSLRRSVDRVVLVWPETPLQQSQTLLRPGRTGAIATKIRQVMHGPAKDVESEAGDADAWCWPATCRAVERVTAHYRPAAVMSIYVLFSRCLEMVPASTLRIVDTNDVFFRNQERFDVEGLAAPRVCTEASEKKGLARADLVLAIQRHDADALRGAFPEKRVITVSHACAPAPARSLTPERGMVLCVGSSNPFNVHGLNEFLTHAWKNIRSGFPEATLHVVGAYPPREDHARVVFRGRLSDEELIAEYRRAHVVINPQVAGTGLKIKSVEAINAGCPLVLNQAGADGLEEGAGSAFLLARDWDDFANSVLRVLGDDSLRKTLETEAGRLAGRLFSPEAVFSEFAHILGHDRR